MRNALAVKCAPGAANGRLVQRMVFGRTIGCISRQFPAKQLLRSCLLRSMWARNRHFMRAPMTRNTDLRLTLALLGLLLLTASASTQAADPLLVDTGWLAQHLKDPNVVVLHVSDEREFAAAHIPGARAISEDDVAKPHDMAKGELMLEMPTPEQLRATFEARGVSDDSHIVVYAGKGTSAQSATRIVLTLDYLGLGERTTRSE